MLILNTFIYFIRTNGFRNPEHEHMFGEKKMHIKLL